MQPQDILVLVGIAIALLYDPFAPFVQYGAYAALKKKIPYAPQNPAVFGIVWYALYATITVAVFLIYLERYAIREWVAYAQFGLFGALLVLTKVWTPIFFGFRKGAKASKSWPAPPARLPSERQTFHIAALVDAVGIVAVVVCFMVFSAIATSAFEWRHLLPTLLMLPTLLWTLFAIYLTGAAIYYSSASK